MAMSKASVATATVPNDREPYWMPFTANRAFKARPRLERPVGRERHPIGLEIVGNRGGCDARFTHGHGAASLLFAWIVHIGLAAFSDNDKAGNGCYHAAIINFSDSVEWPNLS